jgi:hypothetical protein
MFTCCPDKFHRACQAAAWLTAVGLGINLALNAGCGKKAEPAPRLDPAQAPASPEPAPASAPQRAPQGATLPAAAPPAAAADYSAMLNQLTQELRRYCFEHRGAPKSFEEFAASGKVRVPPAPPGKKFAIAPERMEVVLVNR